MTNLTRTAIPAALIALAIGPAAHAQTISPSGGVSANDIGQSGVSLEVDPQKGVVLGVETPETGGTTVGAGPQGAQLNQGSASLPGVTPTPSQQTPAAPDKPSTGDAPAASPAGPGEGTSPTGATAESSAGSAAPGAPAGAAGEAGDSAGPADRKAAKKPAAKRIRGVAPVLDLIERIPPTLWAALVALSLIALAMWAMWVRGRRRLERNAWVDADNGDMNVVAFETFLAQEWARSVRYQRPMGLLLLELEESTSDGGRRPIAGKRVDEAREAIIQQARDADTVAQLSSSRFAVICPESSPGSVETLACALELSLEGEQVHARVGMGARFETDRGPADLVSRTALALDEPPTWAGPVIAPQIAAAESQAIPA